MSGDDPRVAAADLADLTESITDNLAAGARREHAARADLAAASARFHAERATAAAAATRKDR